MPKEERSTIPRKTVLRLSLYRRLLENLRATGTTNIYSHELAHLAGVSAAQVRRDFMVIGYSGSPNRGYQADTCLAAIETLLDGPSRQEVAIVGVGRLGRSVLAHFASRRPQLRITVAFDTNPEVVGTIVEGCPVYDIDELERVVKERNIRVAVLAVPPETGQTAADALVRAGVRSLVDFTALPLRVPHNVFVDHMDITSALEAAAFFARQYDPSQAADIRDAETGAAEADVSPMLRTINAMLARAHMTFQDLALQIGARILTPDPASAGEVTRVYAGGRVRDLLNQAADKALLVTPQATPQTVRVAKLLGVPGVSFVSGIDPGPDIVDLARESDVLLMVSPVGVFDTCNLIHQLLTASPSGDSSR